MENHIVSIQLRGSLTIEFVFSDHAYIHGDTPVAMMADVLCSLPWQQQIPLMPFVRDLLDSEKRRAAVLDQVATAIADVKLEMISLKHDLESTKREKQCLLEKYEGKR